MKKVIALLGAVSLLGVAACGDDDDEKSGGGKAQRLNATVTAQNQLTGIANLKGGLVELNFRNASKKPYDLQFIRVDGQHSFAQVQRVITSDGGPIPGWLHGAGGVGGVEPGQNAVATQVLEPGSYYAVSQAESDEGPNSKPAVKAFKVEGEAGGELAEAPAKITAKDYEFQVEGLKTGVNRIRFANDGKELHHVIALQLKPGKTVADLKKAFQSERQSGPPPFVETSQTGTAVLDGGTEQNIELEFPRAGNWAFVCFISDRKGGPPHFAKGMVTPVTIK